jgi:hypothetical protein
MLCPLSFTAQLLATCTFRVECAEVIAKRWVSDSVKCEDIKNMVIALFFFFFFATLCACVSSLDVQYFIVDGQNLHRYLVVCVPRK